ncbi:MAG: hypothetical protein KDI33_19215 [Halioglobus sp.]|nr:hypothetical protein [Halioglobus sp.]
MYKILLAMLVSGAATAGEMSLYDCKGQETGKIKDHTSERQLFMECFGDKPVCNVKFFMTETEVALDSDGMFNPTAKAMVDATYFNFDPSTGRVQGVTQRPYHYFIGTCKLRD